MPDKHVPVLPLKSPWLSFVIGIALMPGVGAIIEMFVVVFANTKLPIAMAAGFIASLLAVLAAFITPFLPTEWFYSVKNAKGRTVVCLVIMSILLAIFTSGYLMMQ